MDLFIKRKSDGEIFKVRKYVKAEMPDLEEHIWSNDWYGHHIIGSDCEWENGSTSEKDLRVCKVIFRRSNLIQNIALSGLCKTHIVMNNPKVIETVIAGATYKVPTYKVTSEGIEDGEGIEIVFCKGNKDDDTALRQEGVFTETIIQAAKQYLESVNVGEMATRETSMVITKLDEALMWIAKRAEDRKLRGVQATYQK